TTATRPAKSAFSIGRIVSHCLSSAHVQCGLLTHIARPRKAPLFSVELHRLETLVTGVVIPLLPCCAFSSALAQSPNLHSAVPRTSAPTPLVSRRPATRRLQSQHSRKYAQFPARDE